MIVKKYDYFDIVKTKCPNKDCLTRTNRYNLIASYHFPKGVDSIKCLHCKGSIPRKGTQDV